MIWKQYRNTNYEVSDTGLVRNKTTKKELVQHKKYNGKRENDYMVLKIVIEGKEYNRFVHRLVAECFLDGFKEDLEVNHKNFIRYDNRVENLEICTREENHNYSDSKNRLTPKKPVKAISIENGEEIDFNSLWSAGKFIKDNKNKNAKIEHICNNIKANITGKCKSSYGYKWKFIKN